jgi:magnesium chelatase family protein
VRSTRGVLATVRAARELGARRVIVPAANLAEAALVDGVDVLGAATLTQVHAWLCGHDTLTRPDHAVTGHADTTPTRTVPTAALTPVVLRAVEIAATGGHHFLLHATPGSGDLLVADWLHRLLPDLSAQQQDEVTAIQSLAGPLTAPLTTRPPVQNPHHTASLPALLGGRGNRPGTLSRAHHGLLVVDDLPEYGTHRCDALRTALAHREARLADARTTAQWPAHFLLFASSWLCPCGPVHDVTCSCSPAQKRRYATRVPAALLDMFDVRLRLSSTAIHDPWSGPRLPQPLDVAQDQARERVRAARARARDAVALPRRGQQR